MQTAVAPHTDDRSGAYGGDIDFYENFLLTGSALWTDFAIESSPG